VLDVSKDVNTKFGAVVTTIAPAAQATTVDATACCSMVSDEAITAPDAERLARVFKALADPTRVRLVSIIAASEGGEMCICDLTEPVGLSQPTVSHHMKLLTEAGLVEREQRGKWAYFRVVDAALDAAARSLVAR
jgi:ArsR family transcriptional regulator, arsenate/arsenite/antimonite-responsive transcriptional repressor